MEQGAGGRIAQHCRRGGIAQDLGGMPREIAKPDAALRGIPHVQKTLLMAQVVTQTGHACGPRRHAAFRRAANLRAFARLRRRRFPDQGARNRKERRGVMLAKPAAWPGPPCRHGIHDLPVDARRHGNRHAGREVGSVVHTKGVCKLHTTCIAGTVRNACLATGATAGAAPARDQHEAWSDNVFAGREERQGRGSLRRSPRLAICRWLGR